MVTDVRLHLITGKGGVGKSTVAAALAMAAAARKRRVLAIELSGPGGLCRIFGNVPAGPGAVARVDDHIWLSYFDGAAALAEYLTRKVHLGRLLGPVLDHRVYRAFVGAAPGVRELMAIGKVRDELRRRDGIRYAWDAIVVDAGASGHALSDLRIPGAAARAFDKGRVHRESSRIDALLRDPARSAMHVVATPEEMPLSEAAQVIDSLTNELSMPIGALLINQCRPVCPLGLDAALGCLPGGGAGAALARAVRAARGWEAIQERGIASLEQRTGLTAVRLPRVWLAGTGGVAKQLAARIGQVAL